MERLMIIGIIIGIFQVCANAQVEGLEDSVKKRLHGEKVNIEVNWDTNNKELKLILEKIIKNKDELITYPGLFSVVKRATDLDYDYYYDSLFLNHLIMVGFRIDSLFENGDFIRNHFLRSSYSPASLKKLSFFTKPQSILFWKSWTPYYLSFLELEGIDSTLLFLKENIDAFNHLHYKLYNIHLRYDTVELNICLARLGKMSDTLIVNALTSELNNNYKKNYLQYIENLSRIRSQYSFQKIGDLLLSSLEDIISEEERVFVRQMALAAFLAYVKNFPDRSTKFQDTFVNMLTMVRHSKAQGKDYSTNEYLDRAKKWYLKNKDNLILDYDKY